jgi:hypothetical protein
MIGATGSKFTASGQPLQVTVWIPMEELNFTASETAFALGVPISGATP